MTPTSDELLPCPFCGGEAVVRRGNVSKLYYVRCSNIECAALPITDGFSTEGQAARAWNRRAERTCRVTFERIFDEYPYEAPHCSECGQFFAGYVRGTWPHFCPNCGARVVYE